MKKERLADFLTALEQLLAPDEAILYIRMDKKGYITVKIGKKRQ